MKNIEYVYHFVSYEDWEKYESQSFYDPPSLEEEGFIHCCTDKQFKHVLTNYFKDIKNIYILKIHVASLDVKILMEGDDPVMTFPHIYGVVDGDAIEKIIVLNK